MLWYGLPVVVQHGGTSQKGMVHGKLYTAVSVNGQKNDINYAIPLLENININGNYVLADRGYDSNKLTDYIYSRGGKPVIPSRKTAKEQRECDWWMYKERHLVGVFFNKLKSFRRIATRYDKHGFTYLGFICIACILMLIKQL